MSKVNPKQKGNRGELELAKKLSAVFNDSFIRTPHSGAYIGGSNQHRTSFLGRQQVRSMKGDIIPPDNWLKLVIECKNYKDFEFHNLFKDDDIAKLDGPNGWIAQTKIVCETGDFWILCFKITRKGWFIAFDKIHLPDFVLSNHLLRKDYVIADLDNFLNNNIDIIKSKSGII